jgi:hypothetical protein
MTGIVTPRRQLVQPQGRVQVARRWADSLRGAFLLRDRVTFDPVSGLLLSGSGAQSVEPFGTAYALSAASHYIDTGVTDVGGVTLFAEGGKPFSVSTRFRTSSTGTILARAGSNAGARTFQVFSNGAAQAPVVIVRGTQTMFNWGYQDGEWHTVTVVWDGASVSVFGDTDREASFSRGTPLEETTQRILIGARTNGANFVLTSGAVEFAYFFDRALTRDEHLALVANPYQVFRVAPSRIYFDLPSSGGVEVTSDATIRWNMKAAVALDAAIRWSLQQPVQADAALRWSMLQPASADLIARWAMRSIAAADQTAAWSVLQTVEQTQLMAWQLLQAAQADATLRWAMLEAVSGDITALWNIAATLGIVSADLALRWSALAPVAADAALHWHLLNAVARGVDLPWHVVQTIAADSALRWALVSAVQTDLTAAWRLVTAVSADSVLAWDMAAAVGVVAASLSLHWSVVARVQQSIDARWSLLASVGADADMRWDIVTGVMRELTARWELVAQLVASANLDLAWSLVAVSETDLVMRWQVGEVFDLVVRKRFVAGASTRRVFVTGASTRRSFVA